MKRYRIVVADPAQTDLDRMIDYLGLESPEHADETYDAIEAAIATLEHMPAKFAPVGKSRKKGLLVHRLIVAPYLAYYRIEADTVLVLRIRHEKQRPLKRFD